MKIRCRHERTSWIILGGDAEWCYVCGAYRVLRKIGPASLEAAGPWHRPSGDKDVNPFDEKALSGSPATEAESKELRSNEVNKLIEFLETNTGPLGNWSLGRDEHRLYYETVAIELDKVDDLWDWESEVEKQRAIETNRVVFLQWYKDSPIGSYKIAAPDLESMARFVLSQGWE